MCDFFVPLQSISELTDALEDDIRQGNRSLVFERVPLEALKGLLGRERTLAEALTIKALRSRRQSSAYERDGQKVSADETASRDASEVDMLLALSEYAKEKGIWVEEILSPLSVVVAQTKQTALGELLKVTPTATGSSAGTAGSTAATAGSGAAAGGAAGSSAGGAGKTDQPRP